MLAYQIKHSILTTASQRNKINWDLQITVHPFYFGCVIAMWAPLTVCRISKL